MPQNRTLGDEARYVCPYASSQNCKKYFPLENYATIFALTLIILLYHPAPAAAANQFICYSLINNGNRVTSTFAAGYTANSTALNNRAITLPLVRDFCHDSGTGYYYGGAYGFGQSIIATRVVQVPDTADHTDNVQSWDMSSVANKLGCAAANGNTLNFPGINQVIALLPQSPAQMRIPTLITKMAGENTLSGNLAIEFYSGVWQFLGILTSFKLFKIFFKGG